MGVMVMDGKGRQSYFRARKLNKGKASSIEMGFLTNRLVTQSLTCKLNNLSSEANTVVDSNIKEELSA
ncbi:hypothetical protein GOBAR_AA03710 [Gossypium barbadense]|uniref:Uncharacterized protein n=1 Tax=Gossypium barbadense TaxID=3634 RepID=A0A2P5YMR6_GOSBA|nr:hypothetical protein GOBAR_AA03710 [Gossypium barbadense]